jgi:Beta-propeller repeat
MFKQFGTNNNDEASAVAADANGNIFLTGYTGGGLSGGTVPRSGLVQQYDSSLMIGWTKTLPAGVGKDTELMGLSLDQGSVYVTGRTYGALTSSPANGASDLIIVRYEANGDRTWLRQYGTVSDDMAQAAVVRNARVIVGGTTGASLNGQLPIGLSDAVLLELNTTGN